MCHVTIPWPGRLVDSRLATTVLRAQVSAQAARFRALMIVLGIIVVGAAAVLHRRIPVPAGARVGVGDDDTPNQVEPGNLNTGITIVGKRARVPAGAVIGRNCRIGFKRKECLRNSVSIFLA